MSHVIALVDDDRNILTSVSIALQAEGFLTRVYTDGQTALRAFADNAPEQTEEALDSNVYASEDVAGRRYFDGRR